MLWDNPEFIRLTRSKLRPRSMILYGGGAVALMSFILLMFHYNEHRNYMHTYFFTVVGFQFAGLALMALSLAGQNIAHEREKNTLDFQRMVGMGPWRLAVGKLFGCACEAWWLLLASFPFAILPVLSQDVTSLTLIRSEMVVIVFGLFLISIGLAASTKIDKVSSATGLVILLAMFFFSVGSMVAQGGLRVLNPVMVLKELATAEQLKTDMPFMPEIFAGFYGTATLFFLAATARRLTDPEFSFLKPGHAVIGFALTQIGLAMALQTLGTADSLAWFNGVNGAALIAIAFALTPSAELLRGRTMRAALDQHWRMLFERSNRLQDAPPVMNTAWFAAVYVLMALGLAIYWKSFSIWAALLPLTFFALAIAAAALAVWLSLYTEKGALTAAAVLIIVGLAAPPIVIAIASNVRPDIRPESCVFVNPIGYLIGFVDAYSSIHPPPDAATVWTFPVISLVLMALLLGLAAMRIRSLIDFEEIKRRKKAMMKEER